MPRSQAWAPERGGEQEYQTPTNGVAPNGLPYFSWDEGAVQLNRGGHTWANALGTPVTVTYGYRDSGGPPAGTGVSGFQQFNAIQIQVTEQMLQRWAEVANITFVRVGDGYTNNATMLFGNFVTGPAQFSAFAYLPSPAGMDPALNNGDVWVNVSRDYDANPLALPRGAQILLHEIGHTLGLLHPSEYDGGAQSGVTYQADADFWQDTRQFTVQSYFSETHTGASYGEYWVLTPQMFDIAAAQRLYGPNMTTRTGDTVYGFHSNTGIAVFSLTASTQGTVFCIWDAGGVDTIDVSGYSTPSDIDLREESFSSAGSHSFGMMIGNISIARGAVIENAIGGSGADTFIGNNVANAITGNAGNDAIDGGRGADTAIYALASSAASWVRNADGSWTVSAGAQGTDTVRNIEFLDFTDRDVFLDRAAQTFSGDGVSDLLLRNTTTGHLVMWANASPSAAIGMGPLASAWVNAGFGDFNGDGRDDILWRNTANGNTALWFMTGASVVDAAGFGASLAWSIVGVGDIDGDTRDDIVWRNANGDLNLWFMNGGALTGASLGNVSTAWIIETLGDFNGDGRDDFIWRNTSTGAMSMWLMNGASVTGASFANVGLPWEIAGVGDTNGDGRDDVIWRNDVTGGVSIWFMNGSTIAGSAGFGVGADWEIANIGDYNGNGRDDLLWRNTVTGDVIAWYMNGGTITGSNFIGNLGADWLISPGG